jgi:hypothetical protein
MAILACSDCAITKHVPSKTIQKKAVLWSLGHDRCCLLNGVHASRPNRVSEFPECNVAAKCLAAYQRQYDKSDAVHYSLVMCRVFINTGYSQAVQ